MEARGGIEPPIKVLQTFALPLGDRALEHDATASLDIIIVTRVVPMRVRRCQSDDGEMAGVSSEHRRINTSESLA
jgi:hypothetical protein